VAPLRVRQRLLLRPLRQARQLAHPQLRVQAPRPAEDKVEVKPEVVERLNRFARQI
jgi:hypothetical protein